MVCFRIARAPVALALTSKVLVITGGPGVGKTTLVNAILRILAAKGVRLLLCAPTGRAAKRMNEATGFEAKTIHVAQKSFAVLKPGGRAAFIASGAQPTKPNRTDVISLRPAVGRSRQSLERIAELLQVVCTPQLAIAAP